MSALFVLATLVQPVCGPVAEISYADESPADVLVLRNTGDPEWRIQTAEILLQGSAGRLIFDTRPGGPGSQTAQPFRPGAGDAVLANPPDLADGAEALTLSFERFPAGARFVFTTDLDDRVSGAYAGTRVAGAEIAGATLEVTFVNARGWIETHSGRFDDQAEARAAAPCVS
ncbi:MAG: hypothetical protein AAGC57_09045 [Pseudomonadota bacterium]